MPRFGLSRFAPAAAPVLAALALAFAVAPGNAPQAQQSPNFGPAKVAYDDYIKRPSLRMRTRGRLRLAETGDIRALQILSASYDSPEDPKPQVKHLITSITADYMRFPESTPIYEAWRKRHAKTEDAWLWYRSLIIHQEHHGPEALLDIASNHKDLFLRAAALEALAHNFRHGMEPVLQWWEKTLDGADRWRGIERVVMLETAAQSFMAAEELRGTDTFQRVGFKLIPLIEDNRTDARTSLVMARRFRELFKTEDLWVSAEPWLNMLRNPHAAVKRDDRYAPLPPTDFIGLRATGRHIVYVIDLSDSMLIPLTIKERENIRRPKGPVTGSGPDRKPEVKEDEDPADKLPWDKIRTRWDAAREYLKLSLRSLKQDQFFAVIVFGDHAETLRSTRTLVQATSANIQRACTELDRFRSGPAHADRPHGTLKGMTNMHGGLHRAFKIRKSGMSGDFEYVLAETFVDGADTIFLLSDGDPTWDDWPAQDRRDPTDMTGDPESRRRHEDQDILNFPGPYGQETAGTFIPDDVRRMNLFRKTEIHCIGIGEATYGLLEQIARQGMGKVKMVASE
jgi:hypothetical protein